jgi:hypothetical protein
VLIARSGGTTSRVFFPDNTYLLKRLHAAFYKEGHSCPK